MRIITLAALTLAALALCSTYRAANAEVRKHPAANVPAADVEVRRIWVRTPRGSCGPPDYYIVPRYCYDPRDDRVDTSPYAKPVAPVYGLEYGGPSGW